MSPSADAHRRPPYFVMQIFRKAAFPGTEFQNLHHSVGDAAGIVPALMSILPRQHARQERMGLFHAF